MFPLGSPAWLDWHLATAEICRLNRRAGCDHRVLYPGMRLTVPVARQVSPAAAADSEAEPGGSGARFVQARARLLTRCEGVANGCLLLTSNSLLFQPSLSDPLVIDRGPEPYCVARPLGHVTSLTAYTSPELIATRRQDRPDACNFEYRPGEAAPKSAEAAALAAVVSESPTLLLYLCFGCRCGGRRAAAAEEEFWFSAHRSDADALFEFCHRCGVGNGRPAENEADASPDASTYSDGDGNNSDYYRSLLAVGSSPDAAGPVAGIRLPSRADLPLPRLLEDDAAEDRSSRRRRLLSRRRLRHLVAALPSRAEGLNLRLLHSALRDGFSLQSAYRSCRRVALEQRYCLLLVESTEGRLFGAFLSAEPRVSERHYYGTGESFVFRWERPTLADCGAAAVGATEAADKHKPAEGGSTTAAARAEAEWPDGAGDDERPDGDSDGGAEESEADRDFYPFAWTGENAFFMRGDLDHFAVGSGQGRCAIWLDGDLCRGRSQPCDTFNSPVLSGQLEDFLVRDLEIWALVDPAEAAG